MIRSFFAIDLPDSFEEEIRRLQDRLRQTGADVKWVRPESVHLTLKFLGNVPEDMVEPLAEAAGRRISGHSEIHLGLKGVGVFPSRRKARVVWLGLDGDLNGLEGLQKDMETAAAAFGFAQEKRPFKPHLTMGRIRSGRKRAELLAELDGLQPRPLEFTVRAVILFKSDLKPSGAVYTALKQLPLAGKILEESL